MYTPLNIPISYLFRRVSRTPAELPGAALAAAPAAALGDMDAAGATEPWGCVRNGGKAGAFGGTSASYIVG